LSIKTLCMKFRICPNTTCSRLPLCQGPDVAVVVVRGVDALMWSTSDDIPPQAVGMGGGREGGSCTAGRRQWYGEGSR